MAEEHKYKKFFLDEFAKWATRMAIMGCVLVLGWLVLPIKEKLTMIWNTPDALEGIQQQLSDIVVKLSAVAGDNRIIYEHTALSYVKEPVHVGERVTFNLVLRRTKPGAGCLLMSRTALFTDETNVPIAGDTVTPARQIGPQDTPVRLDLNVPPQVKTGRVTVHLSLNFMCGETPAYDSTTPVAFTLLEAAKDGD